MNICKYINGHHILICASETIQQTRFLHSITFIYIYIQVFVKCFYFHQVFTWQIHSYVTLPRQVLRANVYVVFMLLKKYWNFADCAMVWYCDQTGHVYMTSTIMDHSVLLCYVSVINVFNFACWVMVYICAVLWPKFYPKQDMTSYEDDKFGLWGYRISCVLTSQK